MPLPENLLADLPSEIPEELVDILVQSTNVRVERIVSTGHCSPGDFWYDQDGHQWVVVLKGEGRLVFEDAEEVSLKPGDHVMIAAHQRHRVEWTSPGEPTVWLAVFYRD